MEAENKLSDRHYSSQVSPGLLWILNNKEFTGEENDVIPSYVEVNFNNAV
jgi:hypothetical protein